MKTPGFPAEAAERQRREWLLCYSVLCFCSLPSSPSGQRAFRVCGSCWKDVGDIWDIFFLLTVAQGSPLLSLSLLLLLDFGSALNFLLTFTNIWQQVPWNFSVYIQTVPTQEKLNKLYLVLTLLPGTACLKFWTGLALGQVVQWRKWTFSIFPGEFLLQHCL